MSDDQLTEADVADLVAKMRDAASAYIDGDVRHYFDLMQQADDFTLMDPFDGEIQRHRPVTDALVAELEDTFHRGECTLEVVETYASGSLAVLVVAERQHCEVGPYPTQDCSPRATLVFRREDGVLHLVHRHADPLVHPITSDQLATLVRG